VPFSPGNLTVVGYRSTVSPRFSNAAAAAAASNAVLRSGENRASKAARLVSANGAGVPMAAEWARDTLITPSAANVLQLKQDFPVTGTALALGDVVLITCSVHDVVGTISREPERPHRGRQACGRQSAAVGWCS
jgi:hypothetical protein